MRDDVECAPLCALRLVWRVDPLSVPLVAPLYAEHERTADVRRVGLDARATHETPPDEAPVARHVARRDYGDWPYAVCGLQCLGPVAHVVSLTLFHVPVAGA